MYQSESETEQENKSEMKKNLSPKPTESYSVSLCEIIFKSD